jgi:uncharacterized protein
MNRRDLLLAILAASEGRPFEPVQIQKTVFLVTQNVPGIVTEGDGFNFVPYDYGPFDAAVYTEAEELSRCNLAIISRSSRGRWNTYAASHAGIVRGRQLLEALEPEVRQYIENITKWVQAQSFGSIVKFIYETYPKMRENSIF